MQWNITYEKDGEQGVVSLEAADLNAASIAAVTPEGEGGVVPDGAVLITVIMADAEKLADPTMMQSPDGTWWVLGVDDTGKTIWSPAPS